MKSKEYVTSICFIIECKKKTFDMKRCKDLDSLKITFDYSLQDIDIPLTGCKTSKCMQKFPIPYCDTENRVG